MGRVVVIPEELAELEEPIRSWLKELEKFEDERKRGGSVDMAAYEEEVATGLDAIRAAMRRAYERKVRELGARELATRKSGRSK